MPVRLCLHPRLALGPLVLVLTSLLWFAPVEAHAHGASFKDPSDSPKRSARPSPTAPAPPVTTPEAAQAIAPTWKPEGWYRWWELNAGVLLPTRRRDLPTPVTTPQASPANATAADAAVRTRFEAALLKLADPAQKTDRRLLAVSLVNLGRAARDARPLPVLRHWAVSRPAGFQVRESALLGLALLRRDAPKARLSVALLGEVRRLLQGRADDKQEPVRTRAFATLCLGLLADQGYANTALERDGRALTRWLWQRLGDGAVSVELDIARLTALGMQPPPGVPAGVVEGLKAMALGQPVRGRSWKPFGRSHAVTALGRLGKAGADAVLLRLVVQRREHHAVRAAAAIALRQRARRMDAATRLAAIETLRKALGGRTAGTHWLVRSLSQLAVGALLNAALSTGSEAVLMETDADRWLRREALSGPREGRPFCALALGLVYRGLDDSRASLLPWRRSSAHDALKYGLERGGRSDRMLGAYAVALGISGAGGARNLLLEHLKERDRHGVLRGHSALALGLLGPRELGLTTTLLAATRERAHVFLHLQAARALGLLEAADAMDKLKRRFDASEASSETAALALGLAELGDLRAAGSLLRRLEDPKQAVFVRMSCILAAGLLLDPEPGSSAARMTVNANYPAASGAHRRILDQL